MEGIEQIEESLALLLPHTNFVATFDNEEEYPEPRLRYCLMRDHSCAGLLWGLHLSGSSSREVSLGFSRKRLDVLPSFESAAMALTVSGRGREEEDAHNKPADEVKMSLYAEKERRKEDVEMDVNDSEGFKGLGGGGMRGRRWGLEEESIGGRPSLHYVYRNYENSTESVLGLSDWKALFEEVRLQSCYMRNSDLTLPGFLFRFGR